MFAKVNIYGGAKREIIIIPREALIRSGNNDRVIVSLGEGRFQPREVIAGIESGEYREIIKGLNVGDKVVTSGQFLLDSEASLKASLARMSSSDNSMKDEDMADMKPDTSQTEDKKIMSTAILNSVMLEHNMINLSHEPIPALNWPAMEMNFNVKKNVSLNGLNKGDNVEFELEKKGGEYVVTSITKAKKLGEI